MEPLDFRRINAEADLMGLVETGLKRTAASGGGEWAGPCPMCGGRDRFRVQPWHKPAPRWLCRRCSEGRWQSAIDFVMRRDRVGAREAGRKVAGYSAKPENEFSATRARNLPTQVGEGAPENEFSATRGARGRHTSASTCVGLGERSFAARRYRAALRITENEFSATRAQSGVHTSASTCVGLGEREQENGEVAEYGGAEYGEVAGYGERWQVGALRGVERAVRGLWGSREGEKALKWLEGRGLSEATLRYFLVGWSSGFGEGGVYLPKGVTLPCLEGERVWYIKVAVPPGQQVRCAGCSGPARAREACRRCGNTNKYRGVKGNRGGALFNCAELGFGRMRPTLFVEGEFDCMVAWQILRDELAVVTLGSAGGRIDAAYWGRRLLRAGRIYTLYDNDEAGERGRKVIRELCGGTSVDVYLPEGVKDVNEWVIGEGNCRL